MKLDKKDAASLVDTILKELETDDFQLSNCKTQCYDNAALMAGETIRIQVHIVALNKKVVSLNCDNHTQSRRSQRCR